MEARIFGNNFSGSVQPVLMRQKKLSLNHFYFNKRHQFVFYIIDLFLVLYGNYGSGASSVFFIRYRISPDRFVL